MGEPHPSPPADDPIAAADWALLHRPTFSIRTKIAASFLACFVLIGGVALASWITLSRLEHKLYFLEVADRYTNHIQQARRYEKNFLLYGTDLAAAQEHVQAAGTALKAERREIERAVGRATFQGMKGHLERYEQLLGELDRSPTPETTTALREHGAQMVDGALGVAEAERQSVHQLLSVSRLLPLVAAGLLLALIMYVTQFLARQILRPLGRMVAATSQISRGEFTPLLPQRRYRDEFTTMALAINHMATELERRQEMLAEAQKLRAIGTLTAGVAHELNNPINNISLTAEALLEDCEQLSVDELRDLCGDLLSQAERAQGVVRNLLDFARVREPQRRPLEVAELIESTLKLAGNQLRLSGATVDLSVAEGMPLIHGDKQQLSQVLVNLYLNALDAMAARGALRISARMGDEPGFVSVAVTDSGRGIPKEALPYIFDPFFTTKGAKGTGLGLSVSHGIVTKHGGDIRVRSEVGKGTTMEVLLPVAEAPPADHA